MFQHNFIALQEELIEEIRLYLKQMIYSIMSRWVCEATVGPIYFPPGAAGTT